MPAFARVGMKVRLAGRENLVRHLSKMDLKHLSFAR